MALNPGSEALEGYMACAVLHCVAMPLFRELELQVSSAKIWARQTRTVFTLVRPAVGVYCISDPSRPWEGWILGNGAWIEKCGYLLRRCNSNLDFL